jgi:hypothetical protein
MKIIRELSLNEEMNKTKSRHKVQDEIVKQYGLQ